MFFMVTFGMAIRNVELVHESFSKHQRMVFGVCYTLSGRIGKVVPSHAAVALIYTMHVVLRGYCP